MSRNRLQPFVRFLLGCALLSGPHAGCGPDDPEIADAPAYEPPPYTAPPPERKGEDGKSYRYGEDPAYKEAMEKMRANQR